MDIKKIIQRTPFVRWIAIRAYLVASRLTSFSGSASYWESRYAKGGTSGDGSLGKLAEFKALTLNTFVREKQISFVIEFGCGDGEQLSLSGYESYLGFDVSSRAIDICKKKFSGDAAKTFAHISEYNGQVADLVLSLDVIYHLVEDSVFDRHMNDLFSASSKYVAIYSSNFSAGLGKFGAHIKHRCFSEWIKYNRPDWKLFKTVNNAYPYDEATMDGSFANFYFYQKIN